MDREFARIARVCYTRIQAALTSANVTFSRLWLSDHERDSWTGSEVACTPGYGTRLKQNTSSTWGCSDLNCGCLG